MNCSFITNIPAPYREVIHEKVSDNFNGYYQVIYCSASEPNREWKFKLGDYKKTFLGSRPFKLFGRFIYLDISIVVKLNSIKPDVIILSGFSLPFITAFLWGKINRKKIIFFSDATILSETSISIFHRIFRKLIFKRCDALIGASMKTKALYEKYSSTNVNFYQSHLCANNEMYERFIKPYDQREFDIVLCGQMIPRKMFLFSLDVIELLKKEIPTIKVKLLGSGPQKEDVITRLVCMNVDYDYPGFVNQQELPAHYASSKIFLFPSLGDPWGGVANESCAVGTPVITCEAVGASHELLVHEANSLVLDLNASLWANKILSILENKTLWDDMSQQSLLKVGTYNYDEAAKGIIEAVKSTQ